MKLNIIGNIFGSSGYDAHTKQLSKAFHELGMEVRIDCQKPVGWQRNVTDSQLLMLNREFDEEYTSIMIGTPQYWKIGIADNPKNFIGYLVWEGNKIPTYWLEYLLDENVDQIWVPSQHVKDAILNTTHDNMNPITYNSDSLNTICQKIRIVPHGVDLSLFSPKEKTEGPFTFVCNKGWRGGMEDRGGIQYALKAFSEEFGEDEDVKMIIKLNPAYLAQGFDLKQELLNIGIEANNNMLFNTSEVMYEALPEFYRQGDVFVNATRCEGFGLTGLEAQACGLPTIQTNYGGQTDYMTQETDFYINLELQEVKGDIMYEGIKWAVPYIEDLREIMRDCFNDRDFNKDKLAKNVSKWTWRNSAEKGETFLKELEQ